MERNDVETSVAAYALAVRYFRWTARITGVVMLAAGAGALWQGRPIPLVMSAVGVGLGFCWLGWMTRVRLWIGDVHWSSHDARARRQFRRAMRRELR